jgi:ankyrin repeat protein
MNNELKNCAAFGNLERVKQLVEAVANIEDINGYGETALLLASNSNNYGHYEIVVYLVEHGANVAHRNRIGLTALHCACLNGNLPTVNYLLEHGARVTERCRNGRTALLVAAEHGRLEMVEYLLSLEGGASIAETDVEGNTALLLAAGYHCHPSIVQWLLEYGGAQITDTNNAGDSVWTVHYIDSLQVMLIDAYKKDDDDEEFIIIGGEYVPMENTVALTAMLRVMVLHGGPPDTLTVKLAPPLQQIVQDGVRLRARLPAYLAQRRALLGANCPLLSPLQDLVHGHEMPTTTEELWATGLGARLQRSRPERGQLPERRSAHLRRKCL